MNGYVKSPWTSEELFATCAKFYIIEKKDFKHDVNLNHVEEIYCMAATESTEVFLNTALILSYSKILNMVNKYESEHGEILG